MVSKSPTREAPLKILHLSMPKTGSVSMMAAYKTLGLSTYHGIDFLARPDDQVQWEKAIDAKFFDKGKPFTREDFDAFLGEFSVYSDSPAIAFAEEFIEMYPEAKVVLVDRDIEKWHYSFRTQIVDIMDSRMVWVLDHMIEPFLRVRMAKTFRKAMMGIFRCSNPRGVDTNAKETYQRHYEMVRRLVPKERLLNYKLGSGWEPLCQFLGEDVPDAEFPFKNESKEFEVWMKNVIKQHVVLGIRTLGQVAVLPVAVGVGAWMLLKWRL